MGCRVLPKADTSEPNQSVAAFSQRCKALAVKFAAAIDLPRGDVAFAPEFTSTTAAMTLNGRASEVIERNRGLSHPVVPIALLRDDIWIWTGYREAWLKQGAELNFRFVDAGFTLHVGRRGEVNKPQLLRSEWVGRRSRAFVERAGHPHWQLDALESARKNSRGSTVARFGETPAPAEVAEFDSSAAAGSADDIRNLLIGFTIEDMHLASAALWWRPSGAEVVHLPQTVGELDRWILGCVTYLRQEAARCRIPAAAA